MNLIMIYGPPAAGKLTVATDLSQKLGYKLFQNHIIVSCIADVFPFDDKKLEPVLKRLTVKFRFEIYEEAAKNDINLVTTYGGGGFPKFNFFKDVKKAVEKHGGDMIFVQLIPSKESLLERVESESRKGNKIDTKDYLEKQLNKKPAFFSKFEDVEHLSIDNTNLPPEEVSDKIIKYYEL